jgi:hypothetical protein
MNVMSIFRSLSGRFSVLAVLLALAASAALAAAVPAAAASWSGPSLVDRTSGVGTLGQGCAPGGRCFVVDDAGRLVSYTAALRGPGRVIAGATGLPTPDPADMACPSETQCTIITQDAEVETFDPGDPSAAAAPVKLAIRKEATALACPSSARCVATDNDGQVVSFDPADPGAGTALSAGGQPITGLGLQQVVCPAPTQCTAVGSSGPGRSAAVTFDPNAPTVVTTTTFGAPGLNATDLACASATSCVAVGLASDYSSEVATPFDPHGTTAPAARSIAPHGITVTGGLVCPGAESCALFDTDGSVLSFDPAAGAARRTVVDRPSAASNSPPYDVGLTDPRCVSATRCLAVDDAGYAVAVNPADPATATRTLVDPGAPLSGLTCRSRSLCIVTGHGEQGTFGLRHPARVSFHRFVTRQQSDAQCPQRDRCVVVAGNSERTFIPGRRGRPIAVHRIMNGTGLSKIPVQLRCPDAHECVVLYAGLGVNVVTFDPQRGRVIRRGDYNVSAAQALACPSTAQCTALGQLGDVQTFDPENNHRIAVVAEIDRPLNHISADAGAQVNAIACASTQTCVAVDTLGNQVNFDPHSQKAGTAFHIDGDHNVSTIACAQGRCTAGDWDGNVLTGTPRSRQWSSTHLQLAGRITSIACADSRACVATDNVGHLYETTNR